MVIREDVGSPFRGVCVYRPFFRMPSSTRTRLPHGRARPLSILFVGPLLLSATGTFLQQKGAGRGEGTGADNEDPFAAVGLSSASPTPAVSSAASSSCAPHFVLPPWESTGQTTEHGGEEQNELLPRFTNICAMPAYQGLSQEEIRWLDYQAGRTGPRPHGPPLSSGGGGAPLSGPLLASGGAGGVGVNAGARAEAVVPGGQKKDGGARASALMPSIEEHDIFPPSTYPPSQHDPPSTSTVPCWCCSQKDVQFLRRHMEVSPSGDDAQCTICYKPLIGCSLWVNKGCSHTCCLDCGLEHDRQKKAAGQKPMCHICRTCPWEPHQCRRTWSEPAGSEGASGDHFLQHSSPCGAESNSCFLLQLAEEGVPKEDFSCSYWGLPFRPTDEVVRTTCCCRVFSKSALEKKFLSPTARKKLPANQRCLNPVCPSNERPGDFPETTWVDFPLWSAEELRGQGITPKFTPGRRRNSVSCLACQQCSTVFGPGDIQLTACCGTLLCTGCVKVLRRCISPLCAWCDTDPIAGLPEPGSLGVSRFLWKSHTLADLQKSLGGRSGKVINPSLGPSAYWWVISPAKGEALADDRVKIEVEYFSPGHKNKDRLLIDLEEECWGKLGTLWGDDEQELWVVAKEGPRVLLSDLRQTLIDRIDSLPDMRQGYGSSIANSGEYQEESKSPLPREDTLPTWAEIRLKAATFWRVVQVDGNRPVLLRDEDELRVEKKWKLYMRPAVQGRLREVEKNLIALANPGGKMAGLLALGGTASGTRGDLEDPSPSPGNSIGISLSFSPYYRPSLTPPISVPSDAPGVVDGGDGGTSSSLPGRDSQPAESHPTGDTSTTPGLDGNSSEVGSSPKDPHRRPPRVVIEEDPSSRKGNHEEIYCMVLIISGFVLALLIVFLFHRGFAIMFG